MACLGKIIDTLDKGIHTKLGRTGKTLSKGQTQRVLLARALYKDASYLFLDEPTSALDNVTAQQVLQNILSNFGHKSVFIITHKVKIASAMDYIYLIEDGKISEEGDHQSLLGKEGKYKELWKKAS